MSKLDELRSMISAVFDKATDKETIQSVGGVMSKIDEIKKESEQAETNYLQLLTDYKDAVLHGTYKPDNHSGTTPTPSFNENDAFLEAIKQFEIK